MNDYQFKKTVVDNHRIVEVTYWFFERIKLPEKYEVLLAHTSNLLSFKQISFLSQNMFYYLFFKFFYITL